MKFLADAHISTEMVAMLRDAGHDCADAASIPPRLPDIDVLRRAASEERTLITSDKDFGELVFVHQIDCPGVVLMRIDLPDESARVESLRTRLPIVLSRLPGSFVTVTTNAIRVRPIRNNSV